jgi:hypothetical protein
VQQKLLQLVLLLSLRRDMRLQQRSDRIAGRMQDARKPVGRYLQCIQPGRELTHATTCAGSAITPRGVVRGSEQLIATGKARIES